MASAVKSCALASSRRSAPPRWRLSPPRLVDQMFETIARRWAHVQRRRGELGDGDWAQDYLNRNGPAAFEEKLASQEADQCSLRRPPCI